MIRRPLANDANAAVERGLEGCTNLGLILDKFQPWQPVDRSVNPAGWDLFMAGTRGSSVGSAARGAWFTGRVARGELTDRPLNPNNRIDAAALKSFRARWQIALQAAGAVLFPMWTEAPLIIGLGAKGTLETALTLHPLYGFPWLPGSALKGIARAAAFFHLAGVLGIEGLDNTAFRQLKKGQKTPLQELAKALDEVEEAQWPATLANAPQDAKDLAREFRELFGWRGAAGRAIFFDGVPAATPRIVSEVMTPHFDNYYSKGGDPDDGDSPKPISLLAVGQGTPFYFGIGWRGPLDKGLRDKAIEWLAGGLEEIGLGGKTAAGYGFFVGKEPPSSRVPRNTEEADVSGYRPPSSMVSTPDREGDRPGTPETEALAKSVEAQLEEAKREREAKEAARLARKEEKKNKKKKKK